MAYTQPPVPVPPGVYPAGMPQGYFPAPPAPAKPRYRNDIAGVFLLIIVILAHVAFNVFWLHRDNHVICLDESHHVKKSIAYHEALFPDGDTGVFARVMNAVGIESPYPPLAHLVGAVFIQFFDNSPDTVALSGSFAFALLLLGIYVLARQGMPAHNAFLTSLAVSFIPMVYGYSRLVMPDLLLCALVVWTLFALVKSDCFLKMGWTAVFGVLCGLAFLTKQTAFIYIIVPVFLFLLSGIKRALSANKTANPGAPAHPRGDILRNVILCVFVIASVCLWWYLRHLDYLYTWWTTQRGDGQSIFQPGIAMQLEHTLPAVAESPEARIALDPAISGPAGSPAQSDAVYPFTSLLEPYRLFWARYLVYLVNDAVFLPITIMTVLGIPALLFKRNRTALTAVVLSWLAGTYLLLTGMFSLQSPRFLCAAVPAVAFLAIYALDAIPYVRLRRTVGGIFMGLLVLQFVNISVLPLGPIRRVEIPLAAVNADASPRGNTGLTVYKDVVQTGHYTIQPPVSGSHVTEAALASIAAYENKRVSPEGAAAWYQVVSRYPASLGIDYYAQWYAPPPNPFRPTDISELSEMKRPLSAIKEASLTPEETLPELAETEYVILQQPEEEKYIEGLERSALFFIKNGFESIYNEEYLGYGPASPGYVHVMARREFPPVAEIKTIFDIYDMLDRDGKAYLLSDKERTDLEQRYAQEIQLRTDIRPLNEQANFLGFQVESAAKDWFLIRLVIHAKDVSRQNWRVWLRGSVAEEDHKNLFETQKQLPTLVWDFYPDPSATDWKRNEALVLTRPVMAHPMKYKLEIGLYDPENEERPSVPIETEWIDFSAVE